MSQQLREEISRLYSVRHQIWVKRGDLPFVDSVERDNYTNQLRQLHNDIAYLEDRLRDVIEDERQKEGVSSPKKRKLE